MTKNAIFWLRDDFRLKDNPALSYASNNHEIVSTVFIFDKSIYDGKRDLLLFIDGALTF